MNPFVLGGKTIARSAPEQAHGSSGEIVHNSRIRIDERAAKIPVPGIDLAGSSAGGMPGSGAHAAAESRVELTRENGMVRAIAVHCPCGRCIQLVCDYA